MSSDDVMRTFFCLFVGEAEMINCIWKVIEDELMSKTKKTLLMNEIQPRLKKLRNCFDSAPC